MTIQLNSDHNLSIHENFAQQLKEELTSELSRFTDHITRIEVHLSDENAGKEGKNDKRCLLEARFEGKPPVAVTAHGDNYEQAVKLATDKIKASLDRMVDRMKTH
jgi:ribosomal subunit interface protein